MQLILGNESPRGVNYPAPCVTYVEIPDGYTLPEEHDDSLFPEELAQTLSTVEPEERRVVIQGYLAHPSRVKGLPNHEVLAAILHPVGVVAMHHTQTPTWAESDNPTLDKLVKELYGIPGVPDDLEATHYTYAGPPGVYPDGNSAATMLKPNGGQDSQAWMMGGRSLIGDANIGATVTFTASSVVDTVKLWPTDRWKGNMVVAGGFLSIVTSNNSTTLNIDRWYDPAGMPLTVATPAAATPAANGQYVIVPGNAPAGYVALGNTNTAPSSTDVNMADEILTSGGALLRKLAIYTKTAGAPNYTLTPAWTANASDSLPVTVYRLAVHQSVERSAAMGILFETGITQPPTLRVANDQLVLTETITE